MGPLPTSTIIPFSTRAWSRVRTERGERATASAICLVLRPLPAPIAARMRLAIGSITLCDTVSRLNVTRKWVPISCRSGAGRPYSRQVSNIRRMPLPHCSMSPNSRSAPMPAISKPSLRRGRGSRSSQHVPLPCAPVLISSIVCGFTASPCAGNPRSPRGPLKPVQTLGQQTPTGRAPGRHPDGFPETLGIIAGSGCRRTAEREVRQDPSPGSARFPDGAGSSGFAWLLRNLQRRPARPCRPLRGA